MVSDELLEEIRRRAKSALESNDSAAVAAELLGVYVTCRPSDDYAVFLLGDALRILGRSVEAEQMLRRALSIAPPKYRADVMARLGMLKEGHGSLEEAEEWFRLSTEHEEGSVKGWIWILRGANFAILGRFDDAIKCYEKATQLEGDPEEAFLNIGFALRAERRYSEAINAFRESLQIAPDYKEAQLALDGLAEIDRAIELARSVASGDVTGATTREQ